MSDKNDKPDLPGYKIEEKCGEGGMATVWIARQTSLDRLVAIKVLAPELVGNPEAVKRFKFEARAAAKLRHPGIVQVYDAVEHEGVVFFAMEYVPGCTVAELLERKVVLLEKHALGIAEGVALSLQYAWEEARIVHCDIKPGNVMIERDGTIKVADLGLARAVGSMAGEDARRDLMGTPNYTSPEQARGVNDLDCRTDIYALGAMIYHMTTGRLPFGDLSPTQALDKQLFGYLDDPQEINPGISSGTAWLIEKMMIKDRTLRSKDWGEVLTDIHEIRHGGVPAGKMPSAGHSTVFRSEKRAEEPSATQRIVVSEIARQEALKATAERPKQKIVLSRDMQHQLKSKTKKKRQSEARPILGGVAGLLLLVLAGYGLLTYMMNMPEKEEAPAWIEEEKESLPPRSTVHRSQKRVTSISSSRNAFSPVKKPGRKRKTTDTSGENFITWKNPRFLNGARSFNRALEQYQQYQRERSDPMILQAVEKDCRAAISAFEACRDQAPAEVDISQFINNCYRLISDCRQSMLVLPSSAISDTAARKVSRASAMTSVEEKAPPQKDLVLAPTWKIHGKKRSQAVEDFGVLLQAYGRPAADLSPDPSVEIFHGINYLMPVQEVCEALGVRASVRRRVSFGGFPRDSFFYYTVKGDFEGGYDEMLLLTDSTDRIIAAELIDGKPGNNLWFEPHHYSSEWQIYDFIQGKNKGHSKWRIAHVVKHGRGVIRLDSELVAYDEQGYFQLGQTRSRVSLRLPQQIVNLVLLRRAQQKKQAR